MRILLLEFKFAPYYFYNLRWSVRSSAVGNLRSMAIFLKRSKQPSFLFSVGLSFKLKGKVLTGIIFQATCFLAVCLLTTLLLFISLCVCVCVLCLKNDILQVRFSSQWYMWMIFCRLIILCIHNFGKLSECQQYGNTSLAPGLIVVLNKYLSCEWPVQNAYRRE